MKRIYLCIVSMVLCLLLTACGDTTNPAPTATAGPAAPATPECVETGHHTLVNAGGGQATCIEGGYTIRQCADCGATFTEYTDADENNHSFMPYFGTEPATDLTPGYEYRCCAYCGKIEITQSEPVSHMHEHAHMWETEDPPAGTQLSEGQHYERCAVCGEERVTDGTAHRYDYLIGEIKPTCTEIGFQTYRCDFCDEEYMNILTPTGHEYTVTLDTAGACGSGTVTYTCAKCGDVVTREIEAVHQLKDGGGYITPPTCTAAGVFGGTCTVCGELITWDVPPAGHDYMDEEYVAPTCTESGKVTMKCKQCGDSFEKLIASMGHAYATAEYWPNSCEKDGSRIVECVKCGDSYETVLWATGEHNWLFVDGSLTATCTKAGYRTMECSICGKQEKVAVPFAHDNGMGHMGEVYYDPDSTCTEPGLEYGKCSICGENYASEVWSEHSYRRISEPGTWNTWATCEEPAYYTEECEICGDRIKVIVGEQLPHCIDPDQEPEVKKVCGEPVVESGTCLYCGRKFSIEGDVQEHDFQPTGRMDVTTITIQVPYTYIDSRGNRVVTADYVDQDIPVNIFEKKCTICGLEKWE